MKEINHVLSDDNENSHRDEGPMEEIDHWKERFVKITNIIEQLKHEDFRPVVELIKLSHSDVHKQWKDMDNRLTDGFNEAKVCTMNRLVDGNCIFCSFRQTKKLKKTSLISIFSSMHRTM